MYDEYNSQESLVQQPVKSDEIYANMAQAERIVNIISQTSPENQLIDIEYRIKGYKKNLFTNQWEEPSKNYKINNLLVDNFISYLSSLLNDGTRFTNTTEQQINKIMTQVINYYIDDIKQNCDIYGLRGNYSERTRIGHILFNSVFTVLLRSLNGTESKRIWNSLSLNENLGGNQAKKGFLDNLKFWK